MKVSVIVPVYNSCLFIEECLDSILSQDLDGFEVLISDDCSSDGTVNLIRKYESDRRIKLYVQEKNLGITNNCNFLLEKCTGEYVCFFAGDDIMLPGKLKKQYEFMCKNPSNSFSYHPAITFKTEDGSVIDHGTSKVSITDAQSIVEELGVPASMSIMARKDMLPKSFFNNKFLYVSDWLIQIEMAMNGSVGFIDEVLCMYRKYGVNNGKDISLYENEFIDVLDFVSTQYPSLKQCCEKGKARYLLGKLFRDRSSKKRRETLCRMFSINFRLYYIVLYVFSFVPLNRYFFKFIYNIRFFLKRYL